MAYLPWGKFVFVSLNLEFDKFQELTFLYIYICMYMYVGRGFDSHRGHKNFFFTSRGSPIPFTRANARWVYHGFT